jgi:hypothetical protein
MSATQPLARHAGSTGDANPSDGSWLNDEGVRVPPPLVLPCLQIPPVLDGLKALLSASNGENGSNRGPACHGQSDDHISA